MSLKTHCMHRDGKCENCRNQRSNIILVRVRFVCMRGACCAEVNGFSWGRPMFYIVFLYLLKSISLLEIYTFYECPISQTSLHQDSVHENGYIVLQILCLQISKPVFILNWHLLQMIEYWHDFCMLQIHSMANTLEFC